MFALAAITLRVASSIRQLQVPVAPGAQDFLGLGNPFGFLHDLDEEGEEVMPAVGTRKLSLLSEWVSYILLFFRTSLSSWWKQAP